MFAPLAIPFDGYSTDPKGHILGEIRSDPTTGYQYRFIQVGIFTTGTAFAAGDVVVHDTAGSFVGTIDVSDGIDGTYPIPLGIATNATPESTASATNYTWVMIRGYHASIKTTGGDITAGDGISTSTTDGTGVRCDKSSAAITTHVAGLGLVAIASADDSATACAGYVCVRT